MLVRFIFDESYVSEPFKNTLPGMSDFVHFSKTFYWASRPSCIVETLKRIKTRLIPLMHATDDENHD